MQKLDPRFLAMLSQAKIEDTTCTTMGDKGYTTAELFGSFPTELAFRSFCKRILKVDPETEDDDILRYSRLSIVYKACLARSEVENKERVERAVAQLPPQLTENDFDTARRAYETTLGYELPEHLVPSRPFFEKLLAQAESQYEAIKLTHVTSLAEQKVLLPGCGSSGVKWDEKAKTFKEETKDFEVDMPKKPEDLEQRMKLLEHCWSMVKMRYGSNPRLSTVEALHFDRYSQWLKGTQVWNFVIKGSDDMPMSCPSIEIVLEYEQAVRDKQAKLLNRGFDFQKALEAAIADQDLRMQKFMGPFTCSVNTPSCRALSAPGLSHIHPQLQKGTKRSAPPAATSAGAPPAFAIQDSPSRGQAKRAKAAAKKKAAAEAAAKSTRAAEKKAAKGKPKGAGPKGGGRGAIGQGPVTSNQPPPGCRSQTASGQQICFAWNKGRCNRGDNCRYAHESWGTPTAAAAGVGLG